MNLQKIIPFNLSLEKKQYKYHILVKCDHIIEDVVRVGGENYGKKHYYKVRFSLDPFEAISPKPLEKDNFYLKQEVQKRMAEIQFIVMKQLLKQGVCFGWGLHTIDEMTDDILREKQVSILTWYNNMKVRPSFLLTCYPKDNHNTTFSIPLEIYVDYRGIV